MATVLIQFSVFYLVLTVAWSVGLYALLRDAGEAQRLAAPLRETQLSVLLARGRGRVGLDREDSAGR